VCVCVCCVCERVCERVRGERRSTMPEQHSDGKQMASVARVQCMVTLELRKRYLNCKPCKKF